MSQGPEEVEVAFLGGQSPHSLQTCPVHHQSFPSENAQGSCSRASKEGGVSQLCLGCFLR